MLARNKAKEFIKKWEGLKLGVYFCSSNMKTIGFGHMITKSENFPDNISLNEAERLLNLDISRVCGCLKRNTLALSFNSNQEAALISFIFNVGSGAFQSSALRQKLIREEYDLASHEFKKWIFAKGKKVAGLARRREAEKNLFNTLEIEQNFSSVSSFFKVKTGELIYKIT